MQTSGDNGGAICCKAPSVSITLTSCSIINCNSTLNGGGVYVSGASNTLSIDDCLLKDCVTTSSDPAPGGGGLYMSGSASSLTILTSTFLSCTADVSPYGGGGLLIQNMNSVTISSSQILFCSTTQSGGGVYILELTPVFYTDTLFSGNSAVVYGGAIRELINTHSSAVHLKYLFFTNNSGGEDYGNDFSVQPELTTSPFLHSFSTSTSNRVSVYNNTDGTYYLRDNWIPLRFHLFGSIVGT